MLRQNQQHLSPRLEINRKCVYRYLHYRPAVLIVLAFCLCIAVTLSFVTLRSRPIVIKLHSSDSRFVEETIHDIVLLPSKLKGSAEEELALEEECNSRMKEKCGDTCGKIAADKKKEEDEEKEEEEEHDYEEEKQRHEEEEEEEEQKTERKDKGNNKGNDKLTNEELLPSKLLAARRKEWEVDMEIKSLQKLLQTNKNFREHLDIMNTTLPPRLDKFKNPCFIYPPHDVTKCTSGPFATWARFAKGRNLHFDKKHPRLSCLPYFVIAGMPQSGASDVLNVLSRHPDVITALPTTSKWLENVRFSDAKCGSLHSYIDFHSSPTQTLNSSKPDKNGQYIKVIGEMADDLLWDNHLWPLLPGNEDQLEPRFTNADYLHHINPEVKVIIIFQDPTERLYEEYMEDYGRLEYERSAEDFHKRVTWRLDVFRSCLRALPLRTCVYDGVQESRETPVRLRTGLYHVLLQDWLRVFPRYQIHVINQYSFQKSKRNESAKLFKFLSLRELSREEMDKTMNVLKMLEVPKKEKGGKMLKTTRQVLDTLYSPMNRYLAMLMEDDSFLWGKR